MPLRFHHVFASALLFAYFSVVFPPFLKANTISTEGIVVQVSENEVVVDLGTVHGLSANDELEFFRRLVVQHPITKKELQDRFPIGTASVTESGERLSIVRKIAGLSRPPKPGDFVVFRTEAPEMPVLTEPSPTPTLSRPDEEAIRKIVSANMGAPLRPRIARWEEFLQTFPGSAHVEAVGSELTVLRNLAKNLESGIAEPQKKQERLKIYFQRPDKITKGQPVNIAIALDRPNDLDQVRFYHRVDGNREYQHLPLQRDGDFYYRASIAEADLPSNKRIQYFIESVHDDARLEALLGNARRPLRFDTVTPPAREEDTEGRSTVQVQAEAVDFNTRGQAPDWYLHTEASFRYQLDLNLLANHPETLRYFRVGVGTIDGEGGETERINAGEPSQRVSLTYGFAETELEFIPWLALAIRGAIGNHYATEDGMSENIGGMETRLRLGEWDGTRLLTGLTFFEELGTQGFAELHVEAFPKIPIVAGAVVTNFPVGANLGVRLTAQAGYRITDVFTIQLLTGWNARTITHYGYSLGGGIAFQW